MADIPDRCLTPAERRNIFRRPRKEGWEKSHAAKPGTGPEGETCGSCAHKRINQMYSGRKFFKCGLISSTNGKGTDILVRDEACERWGKKDG
jgi:hypothetical protein